MRYSAVLASALAGSAVAMPYLEERALVTRLHTETAIETVVVFVTVTRARSSSAPGQQPTGTAAPIGATLTSSTPSRAPSSTARASSASSAASIATVVGSPTMGSSSVVVRSSTQAASSSAAVRSSTQAASSSAAVRSSTQAAPSAARPSTTTPSQVGPSHVSGPAQATLSSGVDYQNAVLYHHNAARANHRAAPLVWNTTCEQNARIAAQTCNFAHYIPPGVRNGQNLFTVSGSAFNVTAGITESWYKGELPFMTGSFGLASLSDDVFHQVGHFTQVVWQDTTSVGCVSIDCGANMKVGGAPSSLNKFTVCNYAPPGNIGGQYGLKVQPPISTTNLGSWSD